MRSERVHTQLVSLTISRSVNFQATPNEIKEVEEEENKSDIASHGVNHIVARSTVDSRHAQIQWTSVNKFQLNRSSVGDDGGYGRQWRRQKKKSLPVRSIQIK